MTDDPQGLDAAPSTPVTTDEVEAPEPAAPVVPPLEPTGEMQAAPARLSLRERLTPFRVLVAVTGLFAIVALLLGLMVFAPTIAPIKLGSARVAAQAGDVQEIEALARRFARNFLTIDYQTLEADFDRVLADTTGGFRNKIDGVLEVVGDLLRKAKSVSEGEVTSVTVLSRSSDTATVSARVNRTITNERTSDPRPTRHTLLVTLVRTASGWKVDDLTEIPASVGAGDIVPR